MTPYNVLTRMALLRDNLSRPLYQRYAHFMQEDIKRKNNGPTITDSEGNPSGLLLCRREVARLEMAEAYFVTRDMQQLIEGACVGLDDTDQFAQDLWPTEYGFLVFEDGYGITDVRGETLITHAITWGRSSDVHLARHGRVAQSGAMVCLYTDPRDMRDSINQKMMKRDWTPDRMALGDLVLTHLVWFADGWSVGPMLYRPEEGDEEALLARFGRDLDGLAPKPDLLVNDGRFFLSLLLMLNQSVTTQARHELTGHDAKRFRRMRMPQAVTVIQLRRHTQKKQDGEPIVEWQHQWVVRGHWRWQPYGSRTVNHAHELAKPIVVNGKREAHCTHDNCDYREVRIYINPFIKGPEDKPLKQTDKVYALVR